MVAVYDQDYVAAGKRGAEFFDSRHQQRAAAKVAVLLWPLGAEARSGSGGDDDVVVGVSVHIYKGTNFFCDGAFELVQKKSGLRRICYDTAPYNSKMCSQIFFGFFVVGGLGLTVIFKHFLKALASKEYAALNGSERKVHLLGDFVVFVSRNVHREGDAVFISE